MRAGPRRGACDAVVVAVTCALSLWSTRHLLRVVSWPNDLAQHDAMVSWATRRWRGGHVPTDGWFPWLSGGLPQFHHYQSLPHTLTGALGLVTGPHRALHLVLWLLVGTFPIPVYLGGRALGLSGPAAVAAAVASPLVRSATGYGFEPFSYLWLGNGLWSQAWGMWCAPLALGWSARAVRTGRGMRQAVLAVGLTLVCHLPTGWFVVLAVGLWCLAAPGERRARIPRAVRIAGLGCLAAAWVLVPFLVDRWAVNDSSFNSQGAFADSFGWRRVGGWLLAGDILDAGRVPVLSAIAAVGLLVVLARWSAAPGGGREVVLVVAASTVLFVGRDPFGPVIALLPGASQVFLHRYVATLQLGLVWAFGLGAEHLVGLVLASRVGARCGPASDWGPRRAAMARGAVAAIVLLVSVAPAMRSTVRLLDGDRRWVEAQGAADATDGADVAALVRAARRRGGGRLFAGTMNGTGRAVRVGSVPVAIWFAHHEVDALGYTLRVSALAADLETYLDPTSIVDLELFGIRWVIQLRGEPGAAGTRWVTSRGSFQLREVPFGGLVAAVDLLGPWLPVDNDALAATLLAPARAGGRGPVAVREVRLGGRSPVVPASTSTEPDHPGRVVRAREHLADGALDATVDLDRDAALLVRANWNPRWRATVDGKAVAPVMVAPTWLAVPVPAGRHQVALRYRPWPWTPPLLVLALLAVLGAGINRPRWRGVGGGRRRGRDPEAPRDS